MRRNGPKAHAECSARRERNSNLISTYQVSSARLDWQSAQRRKSVVPQLGFEPKPPDFRPGVLTTRPSRQLTFWAYALITTHPWMRRHRSKAHAECSTRREHNSNLISTYQISSAGLVKSSAQRMKSVEPRSGFKLESPDFRPGILTTRPSRQLTFWAYVLITTHPWMRRHGSKAHAECSTRREHNSNLILTYQASSARLERQCSKNEKCCSPITLPPGWALCMSSGPMSPHSRSAYAQNVDCHDGLVVRTPGRKSGGSGSNPDRGTTLFILWALCLSSLADETW